MCINNDYIEDYDNGKKDNNSNDFIKQYNSNNNNISNWTINALKRYHTQCALCVCNESYAQYRRHTDLTVALPLSCSLSLFVSLAHLSSIAFNWAQFVDFYCTCCDQLLPQCAPKIYGQSKLFICTSNNRQKTRALTQFDTFVDESVNLWREILGTGYNEEIKYTRTHSHTLPYTVKKSTECANSWRGFFLFIFFCIWAKYL